MIFGFISETVLKILIFLAMIYLANRWAEGKMNKEINQLKRFKRSYGIFTIILLILWWILTPSGLPDDFITIYYINLVGFTWYILSVVLLTVYLVWRMQVTLVISKK